MDNLNSEPSKTKSISDSTSTPIKNFIVNQDLTAQTPSIESHIVSSFTPEKNSYEYNESFIEERKKVDDHTSFNPFDLFKTKQVPLIPKEEHKTPVFEDAYDKFSNTSSIISFKGRKAEDLILHDERPIGEDYTKCSKDKEEIYLINKEEIILHNERPINEFDTKCFNDEDMYSKKQYVMEKEDIKLQDVESNTKCFKNIEIYPKNYREINEGDLLSLDERPVGDDNANHFKDEDICLKTHDRIEKEEVKMHDERPIGGGSNKKHFKDEDMYPKDYKETKETDVISSHDERPIGRGDNTNLFKDEDMYPKDYTQADQILKSNKKASRKPFLKKKGKNETDQTLENIDKYQETPPIINDKNLILPDESNNNNPNPPNFDERPLPSNKSFPNTADSSFKNAYEDNRPIGGGQKIPFDEPEFLDNNEGEIDKKTEEPLSNRIKSKIWKIRQEAFEELTQLFKNSSPSDEIFIEYSLSLPKLINDSNPASQEKALIAFQTYLEKCPSSKISNIDFCETVKTLIDKCLSPGKPTIKLISNEVLLSLFEKAETLNTTNLIFEGLISSFNNKNPKIVCSSIAAIQELLINYGPKKLIYLKPFFPEMEKMMASTTASIRNESFNFYKEAYKWLGESVLRPFLTNLKKVQIDELEKFFSENPPQKMIAKRLLPQINEVAQNPNGQSQEESIDPYEIADAVEVFQKFNEAFCDKVTGAAKWTEKKELLEEFHKAANVVKIVPNINSSNFSAIMALLKKLLNDNNINVVLISVKVIGVLAKGLRKNLNQNCKVFFPFLLEKVKDKKTSLVEEVKLTLDNFFYCLGIEDVLEELKEVLSDKGSPLVKMHALGWLDRFIDKKVEEGNKSNKFLIKRKDSFTELLPMMKKLSEDGNGEIRDAVLNTLGKIMAVYGEAFLGDFVSRLNNVKSQKLNDSANKMNVTKCNEKMVSNNNNSKANFNKFEENKNSEYDNDMHKNSNINNRPQTSNNNNKTSSHKILIKSTTQKALTSKTKDANPPSSTLKGKKTNNIQDSEESFLYISPEEADEILRPIFSESLFKSLDGSTWKEKFEGFQEINNNFFDVFKDSTLLEAFLISIKPRMKDWKESNLVLNKEFILLMQKVLSLPARPFNKKIFTLFAPYFIEKLIENKKYTDLFNEMIPIILECVNPKHVTMLLISNSGISDLSKKPNPKLLAELCLILNKMINLVTMTHCPLKSLLDFSKLCLNNTLQALRSNVIILLKTMYSFTGKELLKFIIDLNPQILKTVNSELEATAILKENEKIIKINFTGEFGLEQSDKVGSFLGKGCDNILDSMPRNDISAEVNKVLKKLNDPDWKVRREGIDNLDGILASNNYRVCLNGLIDLISILKARLIEKNKNLSKGFILFTGKLAESVGKDIKPYAKTLLIPLMSNLSDKQNFIRSDTLASMDRFAEVLGPETIINIGAATYLANESPEMRNELLNWILKYQDCLNKCDLKGLAGVLLNCLIDRNKEVRSSSELLFEKVISIIGLNEFRNKLQDFKPAVVQQLKPIFEKYAAFSKEVEVNASEGQYSMNNKGKNNKDSKVTHSNKGNASNTNINNINTGKKNETTSNFLPIIPLKGIGSEKSFKVYNNNNNNNPSQIDICEQKYPHLPNSDEITKESGFPMIVNSNLTNPAPIQQRIFKPGHLIADSGLGSGLKTKRVIEEMNHPWSNEELYDDLVMELQRNIKNLITEDLNKKLLSLDFRKHIESVEILKKACVSESNNIKEISDLIIKWCFIRVWGNTNSLIIGQILSLIKNLLILLSEKNYPLFDFEANILAGLLKESLNNDPLSKGYINEIHDLIIRIYPEEKLAHCWLEFYQKTNDFRLKENIIEFLIDRIEIFSIEDVPLLGSIPEISRSTSFMNKILRLFTHDVLQAYGFPVNMKQDVSLSNKKYQDFSLMQKNPKELELPIIQKPIESLNNNRQKEIPKITQKEELCEEHKENDIYSVKKIEIQSKTNEIQSKYKLLRERTHELREKANELQPKPFENKEQINYNFNFNQIIVDSSQQNQLNVLNKLNENFSSDNAKPPVSKKPANNTNNITEESFLLMTNNLKEGSITKKIDSLLMINDITISEKDELKLLLKGNADILALTLLEVLKDSFDRAKSTPNQFIHYFLNILHKVVSLKIFIGSVSNSILANFTEEMIVRLLLEDEAKTTVNQNHSYDFVKLLNSIMLRMLENSNLNEIYSILLDLLIKYRRKANSNTKTLALIIKCLWKLTKSFEGSISEINIGMILLKSHEYLSQLDNEVGKQSEDAGVKTIRTILAELVKIVGEGIWEHYMVIRDSGNPDQYIEKWIMMIMKPNPGSINMKDSPMNSNNCINSLQSIPSLKSSSSMLLGVPKMKTEIYPRHISPFLQRSIDNANNNGNNQNHHTLQQNVNSNITASYFQDDSEIRQVIEEIKRNENFENGMSYLTDYLEKHPGFNLLPYFQDCPQGFIDYVTGSIERIKQQKFMGPEKTLFESRNYSKNFINTADQNNRFKDFTKKTFSNTNNTNTNNTEYENIQNKINQIKQRYGNLVKNNNNNPNITNPNNNNNNENEEANNLTKETLLNNRENVLQKINEMKNKMQKK